MGASIGGGGQPETIGEPSFESKLDIKESDAYRKAQPQNTGILKSTSFFVRALENEQNELNRREDKKAQIDALQAELDSPMMPPSGKLPPPQGSKLEPIQQARVNKTDKNPLEEEKDRQRSVLSTLTYEIMNPVCLDA